MPFICLLLSGAALLANGLATLGHVPRRDAAALNLLVGGTQLVLGVVYVSAAGNAPAPLLTAAGMFLFGATYLYSGLDVLLALGSRGLGWFCGLVAFCGVLLAAAWLGTDPLLAVLWVCWAALWALLFACLAWTLCGWNGSRAGPWCWRARRRPRFRRSLAWRGSGPSPPPRRGVLRWAEPRCSSRHAHWPGADQKFRAGPIPEIPAPAR